MASTMVRIARGVVAQHGQVTTKGAGRDNVASLWVAYLEAIISLAFSSGDRSDASI